MKTKYNIFFGLSVLLLAAMFTVAGCGDNGDPSSPPSGPQTVTYSGTANGTTYTLVITENTSRYVAQPGDSYELTVGSKTSSGTVNSFTGEIFILKPSNSATTFTATVSGNNLTNVSGIITYTGNGTDTETGPGALTSGGGDTDNSAQLQGTWVKGGNYAVEFTVSGSSKTYKMGAWSGGSFNGTPTTGTFTYLGTTLTFIVGQQNMSGTAIISGTTLTLGGFGSQSDGVYTKQGGGGEEEDSFTITGFGGSVNEQLYASSNGDITSGVNLVTSQPAGMGTIQAGGVVLWASPSAAGPSGTYWLYIYQSDQSLLKSNAQVNIASGSVAYSSFSPVQGGQQQSGFTITGTMTGYAENWIVYASTNPNITTATGLLSPAPAATGSIAANGTVTWIPTVNPFTGSYTLYLVKQGGAMSKATSVQITIGNGTVAYSSFSPVESGGGGGGDSGSFVGTWIGGQANTGRFEIKDDGTWSIGSQAPYVGFVPQYIGTYTVSGGTATFTGTSAVGGAPIIGTNTATVNGNTLILNAGGSLMTSFGQTWTRSD